VVDLEAPVELPVWAARRVVGLRVAASRVVRAALEVDLVALPGGGRREWDLVWVPEWVAREPVLNPTILS